MDSNDSPKVIMVPVKRYDINLTIDDILSPLTKTLGNLHATNTKIKEEAVPHLQLFHELVTKLGSVVAEINRIDPSLLASKSSKENN